MHFPKKGFSYISGNGTFLKKFLYFKKELSKLEKSKNPFWKLFSYFGKWKFLLFTDCSSIQLFNLHLSRTQSVRPHLVVSTPLCSPCVTYGMVWGAISHQVLRIQLLAREAQDFPRVCKYFKHVPLLTQLIYFPPQRNT